MRIHDYDPKKGQAFQGDVSILPVPADIAVARTDEIRAIDNKLILQEGELTGHHHHIALLDRPAERKQKLTKPSKTVEKLISDTLRGEIAVPTARLYRDPAVAAEMQRRGILSRADLTVGILIVENGPMVISHQEHDGIRVPEGCYLIGRQVESAGAEERGVAD